MATTVVAPVVGRARTRRRTAGLAAAAAGLVVVSMLSLALGTRSIPLGTTWQVLWHPDGSVASDVIHTLRIPRTLLGLGVGAALGLSGALMQALTRNPLAEPGILGVNLGAATAVVVAIAFLGISSLSGYIWFSFAGAALTSVAVFALGGTGRSPTPERQILAGIALTSVLGAFVWAVLVTLPEVFDRYRYWDVGSLADRDHATLVRVAPFLVVGVVWALLLGGRLNALSLGDEAATAVGASPARIRALGLGAITLLCGAATAATGPIWFLGLAVPYVARLLVGADHRWVLGYSVLIGPSLLLLSDIVGRVAAPPSELQVGVVTAFVGAPVFLLLCRRRRIGQL
ncbi:FecCD family ABC transporter permease [Cryptosporangium phraense]|uniref:Iron chelate uptake ABC transporter family permease subunit n=1 Tax=Cryptosporangium phraense TaxID=2593070 RepID=A0A545B0E8_9ACTN|nr:iron chelate uptake ABC transporter family permease subunit [Cryptosporangium phraense]TQS47039.1 iron chelate uptake ABC transporter family permease subunit [Cryptosporangium phraense]